eukprot:6514114-Heterocapsa_arctica.AAC.1
MTLFHHIFQVRGHPTELLALPRRAASELLVLAPLAVTNLRAPVSPILWATDASPSAGAVVRTRVPQHVVEAVWAAGERRGLYSRLELPARVALRMAGVLDNNAEEATFERAELPEPRPERQLAMRFDAIEVLRRSRPDLRAMANRGLVVGPVCDLGRSQWFDLKASRFLEWLIWMLCMGRLLFIVVEPPCTTFS